MRNLRRRQLWNPAAWLRLAFERIVGLPRYMLRTAGFPRKVADSTGARIFTVLWGAVVGLSTIGAFVLALIAALD